MPLIKSAIKKVRVDAKRRQHNLDQVSAMRTALKKARAEKSFALVSEAYSALDRAVKANLIHRNFAARQKASLAKIAKPTKLTTEKPVKKATKKAAKKTAPKASKKPTRSSKK